MCTGGRWEGQILKIALSVSEAFKIHQALNRPLVGYTHLGSMCAQPKTRPSLSQSLSKKTKQTKQNTKETKGKANVSEKQRERNCEHCLTPDSGVIL